jgi:hypothetical protein
VTSTATGVITTIVAERGGTPGTATRTVISILTGPEDGIAAGTITLPADLHAQFIRVNPSQGPDDSHLPGLITCAALATVPGGGTCPRGAEVAEVFPGLTAPPDFATTAAGVSWPASAQTAAGIAGLGVIDVFVATDGTPAAIERARTALGRAFPHGRAAATEADFTGDFTRLLAQFQRLADVVIIASLVVAGCGLAVSVTGGLTERRRPFAMLRLSGVRLSELRRVVALETAVPLLAVAVVAVGTGFLAAHLFLRSQMKYDLHAPGPAYYAIVVAGLIASLAVIASTMPLLSRMTGPAAARYE